MTEHPSFNDPFVPPGEPIKGKTYRADGWAYQDIPRMSPECWARFLYRLGEGNWVVLTLVDYGDSKRGQLLISPQGMTNISTFSENLS